MKRKHLRTWVVRSGLLAGLFGIAVFFAVDFLFDRTLQLDSRALLGAVLALGIVI